MRCRFHPSEVLMERDEHILRQVFSLGVMMQEMQGQSEHHCLMLDDEFGKR
jgi:hypothetical protein